MAELSIYVDESGAYKTNENGEKVVYDRFYLFSLLLIDQNNNLSNCIDKYNNFLIKSGIGENDKVHCMPLINRDNDYYKNFKDDEVRNIIFSSCLYIKKSKLDHITILMDAKKQKDTLKDYFTRELHSAINDNIDYFKSFDSIKIYYDDGQDLVKNIIFSVFDDFGLPIQFSKPKSDNFRILEMCDVLCSITLIAYRIKNNVAKSGEKYYFGDNYKEFCKTYYNAIKSGNLIKQF